MSSDEETKSPRRESKSSPTKATSPKSPPSARKPRVKRSPSILQRLRRQNSLLGIKESLVDQLKQLKTKITELTTTKETQMIDATRNGDAKKVRELIKAKPSLVHHVDERGYTPIMTASREGELAVVKALIKGKCKVNARNKDDQIALHLACAKGYPNIVRTLLEAKAKVNAIDSYDMTPLVYASHNNKPEVVKLLLERSAAVDGGADNAEGTAIVAACKEGNKEVVELLLAAKADLEAQNSSKETAIVAACENKGSIDIVKLLLEAKAKTDARDSAGRTALLKAAAIGDSELVDLLLPVSSKETINAQQKTGETALYLACIGGAGLSHQLIVRNLLEAKADPEIANSKGDTPIFAAAENEQVEIIKTLLLWGHANANHRNKAGHTALRVADHHDKKEAVKLLKNETEDDPDPTTILSPGARGSAHFVKEFSTATVAKPTVHHR